MEDQKDVSVAATGLAIGGDVNLTPDLHAAPPETHYHHCPRCCRRLPCHTENCPQEPDAMCGECVAQTTTAA